MLTRGQSEPSGMGAGTWGLSSVHGQPVLPGGGGGSSLRIGQRMIYIQSPPGCLIPGEMLDFLKS